VGGERAENENAAHWAGAARVEGMRTEKSGREGGKNREFVIKLQIQSLLPFYMRFGAIKENS